MVVLPEPAIVAPEPVEAPRQRLKKRRPAPIVSEDFAGPAGRRGCQFYDYPFEERLVEETVPAVAAVASTPLPDAEKAEYRLNDHEWQSRPAADGALAYVVQDDDHGFAERRPYELTGWDDDVADDVDYDFPEYRGIGEPLRSRRA